MNTQYTNYTELTEEDTARINAILGRMPFGGIVHPNTVPRKRATVEDILGVLMAYVPVLDGVGKDLESLRERVRDLEGQQRAVGRFLRGALAASE